MDISAIDKNTILEIVGKYFRGKDYHGDSLRFYAIHSQTGTDMLERAEKQRYEVLSTTNSFLETYYAAMSSAIFGVLSYLYPNKTKFCSAEREGAEKLILGVLLEYHEELKAVTDDEIATEFEIVAHAAFAVSCKAMEKKYALGEGTMKEFLNQPCGFDYDNLSEVPKKFDENLYSRFDKNLFSDFFNTFYGLLLPSMDEEYLREGAVFMKNLQVTDFDAPLPKEIVDALRKSEL